MSKMVILVLGQFITVLVYLKILEWLVTTRAQDNPKGWCNFGAVQNNTIGERQSRTQH